MRLTAGSLRDLLRASRRRPRRRRRSSPSARARGRVRRSRCSCTRDEECVLLRTCGRLCSRLALALRERVGAGVAREPDDDAGRSLGDARRRRSAAVKAVDASGVSSLRSAMLAGSARSVAVRSGRRRGLRGYRRPNGEDADGRHACRGRASRANARRPRDGIWISSCFSPFDCWRPDGACPESAPHPIRVAKPLQHARGGSTPPLRVDVRPSATRGSRRAAGS